MNDDNVKLTFKQEQFIYYYLQDGNGAQAAIKAGYSERTARSIASENLTKPYIRSIIESKIGIMQQTKSTKVRLGFVYLIQSENLLTKIGSSRNVHQRFKDLLCGCPVEIIVTHTLESENYIKIEAILHKRYDKKRIRGEWFNLSSQDIADIEKEYGFIRQAKGFC